MAWRTTKLRILIVIAFLYAFTWIGGWIVYSRDVAQTTATMYEGVKQRTIQEIEAAKARGASEDELSSIKLRGHSEEGPSSGVFCMPLLPGLLLAEKEVGIGPLRGSGTRELVFFYGWGSMELCRVGVMYRV
jgi:hypothetical protein